MKSLNGFFGDFVCHVKIRGLFLFAGCLVLLLMGR